MAVLLVAESASCLDLVFSATTSLDNGASESELFDATDATVLLFLCSLEIGRRCWIGVKKLGAKDSTSRGTHRRRLMSQWN